MLASYLLPETELQESGAGPACDLGESSPTPLLIQLSIDEIVEQESLDLQIEGSADGSSWKRVLAFPQKFYTGRYQMLLDVASHPGVRYLRAKWALNRWGRGDMKPYFCASVAVREQPVSLSSAVTA